MGVVETTGLRISCRAGHRRVLRAVGAAFTALATAATVTVLLAAPATADAAFIVSGVHRWADTVSTNGGHDAAVAVATNKAGYPIVVGTTASSGGDYDIRYRSYLPDGSLRWAGVPATWDGSGGHDTAAGVVVDKANGYVYVAGTTKSADGDEDYVILKLLDIGAGGGTLLWAETFDAAPGGNEEAAAIARDKYGNIYVTGSSQRSDGSWDLHIVKYRPNGTRAWAKRHNSGGNRPDRGVDVAVRGSSVFVTGVSQRPGRRDDVVLIKYSLGGSREWVRYFDDPLHRSEDVSAMAVTSGSVYLCGSGKRDALLLKYGHDGRRKWARYTAGNAGGQDRWWDVAVDNKARVHVTGYCLRKGSNQDIVTRLYSSSGSRLWQRIFKTNNPDVGTALAVDSSRRTYVCGHRVLGGDDDIVFIKYGTGGATLWKSIYPDPARYPSQVDGGTDGSHDIAVAGSNVYVAGQQMVDRGGALYSEFLTLAIWR